MKKEFGIAALLLAMCVWTYSISHAFVSPFNLSNLSRLAGIYGILGIGMGVVIITGGIDLSVGSLFALQGVILVRMLMMWHIAWPVALLIALVIPLVMGLIHGLLITKLKLQPFIVTLCGLLIYRSIARYFTLDNSVGFQEKTFGILTKLAKGTIEVPLFHQTYIIPSALIILVIIAAIMWFVLHKSVYGRYLFAVGKNEDAARYSGINSTWIVISAYMLCSFLAGISGVLSTFYSNSVSPADFGNSYELYAIAAAVLGGCSLRGGEGSVVGVVMGACLLQVLNNFVNLNNIPDQLNACVTGGVILAAVLVDQLLAYRHQKNRKAKTAQALAEKAHEKPATAETIHIGSGN